MFQDTCKIAMENWCDKEGLGNHFASDRYPINSEPQKTNSVSGLLTLSAEHNRSAGQHNFCPVHYFKKMDAAVGK